MEEQQCRKFRFESIAIPLAVAVSIACTGITSTRADTEARENQKSPQCSTLSKASSNSGKWDSLRREAIEALTQKDYAAALDKLNQALKAVQASPSPDPEILSEFHHRLALANFQKGSLDDADRECDEALAGLSPLGDTAAFERAKILNNASVISSRRKQFDKASLQAKEALELTQKAAPDKYALAAIKVNMACYSVQGTKSDPSSNLLKEARNLPEKYKDDPTANAANMIIEGLIEYRAGHTEYAVSKLKDATEIAKLPKSMLLIAQNNFAVLLAKTGKLTDAEKLLESAAELTLCELDGALIKRNRMKISSFDNKAKFDRLELEFLDPLILVKPELERRKILVPRPN